MELTTPQEEMVSDNQNCHDTPLILALPSNCSTIDWFRYDLHDRRDRRKWLGRS